MEVNFYKKLDGLSSNNALEFSFRYSMKLAIIDSYAINFITVPSDLVLQNFFYCCIGRV